MTRIAQGPEWVSSLITDNWQQLVKPCDNPVISSLNRLVGKPRQYFVQIAKEDGVNTDNCQALHPVNQLDALGEVMTFKVKTHSHFSFAYDLKDLADIAPEGANAYRFVSGVTDGVHFQKIEVQFYRADIDYTVALPQAADVRQDYDLLMQLVA